MLNIVNDNGLLIFPILEFINKKNSIINTLDIRDISSHFKNLRVDKVYEIVNFLEKEGFIIMSSSIGINPDLIKISQKGKSFLSFEKQGNRNDFDLILKDFKEIFNNNNVEIKIYQSKNEYFPKVLVSELGMKQCENYCDKFKSDITLKNYSLVYVGFEYKEKNNDIILSELFFKGNSNQLENFNGRSISVGDIIFIKDEGFFCRKMGWEKLPELFSLENNSKHYELKNVISDLLNVNTDIETDKSNEIKGEKENE